MATKPLIFHGVAEPVAVAETILIVAIRRCEAISENATTAAELASSVVGIYRKVSLSRVAPKQPREGSKAVVAHLLAVIGVSYVVSLIRIARSHGEDVSDGQKPTKASPSSGENCEVVPRHRRTIAVPPFVAVFDGCGKRTPQESP